MQHTHRLATDVVHAGRPPITPDGPLNPPITLATSLHAGGEVGYTRTSSPVAESLESALGALDGGRASVYASGMAAASAALDLAPPGCVVVAPTHCYYGVAVVLDRGERAGRWTVRRVAMGDSAAVAEAIDGAGLVWLETPTNPLLEICDIEAAAAAAKRAGALVVCDSTFAPGVVQRPLDLGCDVVMHSVSKYLSGHTDVLLGALVTSSPELHDILLTSRTAVGNVAGPFEAWLALRGVRTLALRLERSQANAATLAQRLTDHPSVSSVHYPGLASHPGHRVASRQMTGYGAVVSIEVVGGGEAAERVCASTELWVHATSLGGVESLLERRRKWSGESVDVPESLIRLSVGIEDVEDLWADLDAALRASLHPVKT